MRVMFELRAASLYSKFGFSDGDVVTEALYNLEDNGHPVAPEDYEYNHEALIKLVRAKLLPVLPAPLEVYEIISIHNPIRAEPKHLDDDTCVRNAGIFVEVTDEELLACLAELKAVGK